ncbi:MAG: hypothetical protein ABIJ08_01555 [Nanoarchaeota archaeon]
MPKKNVSQKTMPQKKAIKTECCKPNIGNACNGGGIYGLGFIGAAVYYLSISTGFWNGLWGVVKAMLWPAFLIYELLKFLG